MPPVSLAQTTPPPVAAASSATGSRLWAWCMLLLLAVQCPLIIWLNADPGALPYWLNDIPWLASYFSALLAYRWLPLLIAGLLSVLCLRLVRQGLTEPILDLADQIEAFTRHDYRPVVTLSGNEEIRQLATACDTLRAYLQKEDARHQKLAFEDSMTGLHNRTYFSQRLDEMLSQELKGVIVVVWSIDRFKSLNNILGFAAGDYLLKALGLRFKQQLDRCLLVARLANHTFAAAFDLREEVSIQDCVGQILGTVNEPVRVYGQPIDLSVSCGVALSPRDGHSAQELLRRAEIAQSIANQSRMQWITFQNHFEVQSTARLTMLSELRAALQAQGQLQLFLQPKLNLASGRVEEAEALIRWHHPQRGWVFPNEFIPFAEQTGRIHDITRWTIREALRLIHCLTEYPELRISVNVSALDLVQPAFDEDVVKELRASKVAPNRLCLEITESHAMDDPNRVMETLKRLSDHGIYLAIDDFGSGYSSLAYMKRFPVQELKIDRALVSGVKPRSDSETILRCIIDMGHHMGLKVTAEGVETLEEYSVLNALAADSVQGYLIAKAMPLEQFRQFAHRFSESSSPNPAVP